MLKQISLISFKIAFFAIVKDHDQSTQNQTNINPASFANRIDDLIQKAPLQLNYSITKQGISSLRHLSEREVEYLQMSTVTHNKNCIFAPLMMLIYADNLSLDKSHEMILGVNETNINAAEYAAKNPGMTTWSDDHPLNAEQDMLHSIIHRLEGSHLGEGGCTGYANAKYWLFGGDKAMKSVEEHAVRKSFRQYVLERDYFHDMGLFASENRSYKIIAGRGKQRVVSFQKGQFDFIRYYDLCELRQNRNRKSSKTWKHGWTCFVDELQRVEFDLLFKHASGMLQNVKN